MLPNFVIIGSVKSGSTSLYHYLRSHPEVFMPEEKELRFFIAGGDGRWRLGREWYEKQFAPAGTAIAVGEATPGYTLYPTHPGVPERMASLVPDARLIYVVREPVDRMVSHYQHKVVAGAETRPLHRALREQPLYFNGSCYALQIERFLEHFPREQLLVIASDRLRDDRARTVKRVFDFIGVDPSLLPEGVQRNHNVTSGKRAPRPITMPLRESRAWKPLAAVVPAPVKAVGRRLSHAPVRQVQASPALRADLEERLRDDIVRLRPYVEGEFDGWGIA